MREDPLRLLTPSWAECIGCSCTDDDACPGGCHWLVVDYGLQLGVCSNCPEHLERWAAGDRSVATEELEAFDDDEPRILLPGDPDFHL